MARGNRMGPNGMGPMTGRGLGYCNGYESPGYTKDAPRGGAGFGRGFGRGFERGYGRGFGYGAGYGNQGFSNYPNYPAPQYSAKDEEKYLESEMNTLKNQIKTMEARLSELKKDE